jgi:hypothetical protein
MKINNTKELLAFLKDYKDNISLNDAYYITKRCLPSAMIFPIFFENENKINSLITQIENSQNPFDIKIFIK